MSVDVRRRWDELRDVSPRWADGLTGSSLPSDVVERTSAQASLLRSPTCFVDGAGADEVWSGIEYQVCAHCLYEGLDDDAYRVLRGLWAWHSGGRRIPFNEIECGDHYARALAGWSVLEAATGHRFDALTGRLRLRSVPDAESWSTPILTDTAWGTVDFDGTEATLSCAWGRLTVNELIVDNAAWAFGAVKLAQGQQVSTSTL